MHTAYVLLGAISVSLLSGTAAYAAGEKANNPILMAGGSASIFLSMLGVLILLGIATQ